MNASFIDRRFSGIVVGALIVGFATGYYIRGTRDTVAGNLAEGEGVVTAPSAVRPPDERLASPVLVNGGSDGERNELETLRRSLAEERSVRRKLSEQVFAPMTSQDKAEVSKYAGDLLDLSEAETTEFAVILTKKFDEIRALELQNAELIQDAEGDYLRIPVIGDMNEGLDAYFKEELPRILGEVRGEIAFHMVKNDQNFYSGFKNARELFIKTEDSASGESLHYMVLRHVGPDGSDQGGQSTLIQRDKLPARYRLLFDSIEEIRARGKQ